MKKRNRSEEAGAMIRRRMHDRKNPEDLLSQLVAIKNAKRESLEFSVEIQRVIAADIRKRGVSRMAAKKREPNPLLEHFIRLGELIKDSTAHLAVLEEDVAKAELAHELRRRELMRSAGPMPPDSSGGRP